MAAPVVICVGGSDSSGSAGLQADLPTLAAFGVHAATVVTVVTAQDSTAISAAQTIDPAVIAAQLDAVIGDLDPAAAKTGLLGQAGIVALVTDRAAALTPLVVDPVLVDGRDEPIVDEAAIDAYRLLIATARMITPNRREASLLLGRSLPDVEAVVDAAEEIRALGARWALVTGGRDGGPEAVDVLIGPDRLEVLRADRIEPEKARGSGCALSAAIAAELANGATEAAAVNAARSFVRTRLERVAGNSPGRGRPGLSPS